MTLNLDNANGLATLTLSLLLILGTLLAAARWFIRTELAPIRSATTDTLHQVKNSHTTNLRDDLDSVHEKLDRLDSRVDGVERRTGRRLDAIEDKQDATAGSLAEHVEQSKTLLAKGAKSEDDIRHSLADVAAAVKNLTEGA